MSDFDYDLFVVGGGSGGVRAARIAAGHGAKVAIAEEYRLGGTCVIRGCVPKKLLVYASRFRDDFEDAAGFGWSVSTPSFDWPTLIANKDAEITRLEGLYRSGLERAGVTILQARAELADAHTLTVQPGNRRITAKIILVATGGRPTLLEVPGAGHAITSNEAFHMESLPKSILIAGGGYIAVEFASIFNGLGVDTTLIYRAPKILRGFDEELRDHLSEELQKRGIDVLCDAEIASIDKGWLHYNVALKDGRTIETAKAMFATGRQPNTKGIGLEAAGVKLGDNGEILVDGQSRSSVESIYAVGDVTDRVNLTPVAIREGHAFADTVFGNKPVTVDHELVPTAVFSTPEIGTVGLHDLGGVRAQDMAADHAAALAVHQQLHEHALVASRQRVLERLEARLVDVELGIALACLSLVQADGADLGRREYRRRHQLVVHRDRLVAEHRVGEGMTLADGDRVRFTRSVTSPTA